MHLIVFQLISQIFVD